MWVNEGASVYLQGTVIMANQEYCHKSKKYWERPEEFYPEHFIDKDGKLNTKKEGFLPFSIGKKIRVVFSSKKNDRLNSKKTGFH